MEPTSTTGGIAVLLKTLGVPAVFGMIGAAVLYLALPPLNPDGTWNKKEMVLRLVTAGIFSDQLGPLVVDILVTTHPWAHADRHTGVIYMAVGAPGWWVSRSVALFFHNRRGKDILEVIKAVRKK